MALCGRKTPRPYHRVCYILYASVCVYYVCMLVCVIRCMHAHSYARESQQLTSGILLYYSPHYYLRQILSVDLAFTDLLG